MYWWLVFVIQVILVAITVYMGSFQFLWDNDVTKLSFLTTALWILTSLGLGFNIYFKKQDYEPFWFIADACMTIGMIGTVTGFMLMLGSSFKEIDPGNIDSMRRVIVDMASGMSTALLTTLVGLIASLFIKVQIVIQESTNE